MVSSRLWIRALALDHSLCWCGFSFHACFEEAELQKTTELDLSIGLILALLALPGAFYSLFLLEKYSTLLQWMHGQKELDPLAGALPDEYFFIVLSMVVTGVVAVWRWDSIFPDRRDYANLVPLPISLRSIFLANLAAILVLGFAACSGCKRSIRGVVPIGGQRVGEYILLLPSLCRRTCICGGTRQRF